MSKIAILTDSTSYLPQPLLDKYNIHTVPLAINWDGETYFDGIDLTPADFYPRLAKSSTLPTTSQPSVSAFLEKYEELAANHDAILVPVISSGISGTHNSAILAAEGFNKVPVLVIDSLTTAGGLALVVLAAAEAAAAGKNLEEIASAVNKCVKNIGTYFVVDTLEYLHKGGRIGGASRYFGAMLNIKPILFLNLEGKIDALERVRTKKKALARLVEIAQEKASGGKIRFSVMHSECLDEAQAIQAQIESLLDCEYSLIVDLSPVVGTHVGQGTIGVCVYPL